MAKLCLKTVVWTLWFLSVACAISFVVSALAFIATVLYAGWMYAFTGVGQETAAYAPVLNRTGTFAGMSLVTGFITALIGSALADALDEINA